MNTAVLIDALVRQTTVLIAEIATATESRPTLAHTADEVFRSLVEVLRSQGASSKTIADMFGLTLRTYHKKVARVAEADLQRGRVLREEILAFIRDQRSVRKATVLEHFESEDPVLVAGLLRDVVRAELVFQSGSGPATAYRIAREDDLPPAVPADRDQLGRLLWFAVYRYGPSTLDEVLARIPADEDDARASLEALAAAGRITVVDAGGSGPVYAAAECVIQPEDPAGWPAAFFDHFQAMVGTFAQRLRRRGSEYDGRLGGATFALEVWPGHPMLDEAMGLLSEARSRARELRSRINAWNAENAAGQRPAGRVVFYAGQSTIGFDEEKDT